MNLSKLNKAVGDVCPISGVYIGKTNDKSTWGFHPLETATDEQKTAAQAVIDAADLSIIDDVMEISKLTIVDRLIAAGKINDAMSAMSANPIAKMRWDAAVAIDIKDESVIALLTAIGVDPNTILY